jgi:uncharacterized protein YbaA (DUF1428 family)
LLPVPKKRSGYSAWRKAGKIWKEYGALDSRECVAAT